MAAKITGRRPKNNVSPFPAGAGRKVDPDDNLTPEQKAERDAAKRKERDEAEAIQLLSVISRIREQRVKTQAAKAIHDAEKAKETDIFRAAKLSGGFIRKELEDLIADSKAGERKNVMVAEARRVRFRMSMGLPVGLSDTEQELISRLPDVEREGTYWAGAGYTDGVSGAPHNPPKNCIEAGHGNRYDEGYKGGQAQLAVANAKPKTKPAPAAPNPLDDPHSPESLKAAAESEKRARASLEAMQGPDAAAEEAPATQPADGFTEATAEELAAQTSRPAPDADTSGEAI